MISMFRPGTSLLHRLPTGPKVLLFAVLAFAIGATATSPAALGVALIVVTGLFLVSGLGLSELARQAGRLRWVLVATLVPQLIFLPMEIAAINTSRVLLVILSCTSLSITTSVSAMLDATERTLNPLRRFGVDPTQIGLVLALTITTIPNIVMLGLHIRDAQRARGGTALPHVLIVPLLVAALRHADHLTEALLARSAS